MISDKSVYGLHIERHVDPDNGSLSIKYFYNGKAIPMIAIEGEEAERLSGLTLIQKDLNNARRWAAKAAARINDIREDSEAAHFKVEDREVGDEAKALFVAALVFYAKAFTKAAGRRAQMSRSWLDLNFREVHDSFMSYRHNMAAHSGSEKQEYALSYLLLVPEGDQVMLRLATNRLQPDFVTSDNTEEQFDQLIEHAISKVIERYNKLGVRIINRAIEMGPEYWIEASKLTTPVNINDLVRRST